MAQSIVELAEVEDSAKCKHLERVNAALRRENKRMKDTLHDIERMVREEEDMAFCVECGQIVSRDVQETELGQCSATFCRSDRCYHADGLHHFTEFIECTMCGDEYCDEHLFNCEYCNNTVCTYCECNCTKSSSE